MLSRLNALLAALVLTRLALPGTPGAESTASAAVDEARPNVVYVMSDELAYFELGHMGNPYIRTPNIDRFAAEGMRFTRAYAGSPVCAPLRCNLITGLHAGHASVRANDGGTPLREGEPTIATMLKDRGYATGGFGKWGCGGRDSTGVPEEHGFDIFFGYYDQVHAHTFYPAYLVRNSEEVPLKGNVGGRSGETYSHYEIMDAGLDFIRENKDRPFFCYLPITPPHGMYDIPADDPVWALYEDDEWMQRDGLKQDVKNYAAMVSLVDRNLGQVLDLLQELGLDENTVVFFTGDNGGQDRFRSKDHPRGFFGPNVDPRTGVEFRGGKGNLFEGGLRIPSLARWPGRIPAGAVSDLVFYQPDVLPTIAALTGATPPDGIDGISIAPTLLASGDQAEHDFLYWEFGSQLAVRMGDWKGLLSRKKGGWDEVLAKGTGTWSLYDLSKDVSEQRDVSAQHPERIAAMAAIAAREFTPARPGTYRDPARTRHEKDRDAKWG
ncbi:MAG: arylsulfatase, partial [Planctomycetota bacterium]|nr:arylsulfatase [Planctomycetota bacterium]